MVFHGVALCLVLFVAPVREIVFKRKDVTEPDIITRGDELQEVIDEIRDRTAEQLTQRVAILKAGKNRMTTNFETLNRHFQPFVDQQRATARARMQKYIDDALQLQKVLLGALEATKQGGAATVASSVAHESMSRILTAQEEIRRGIRLLEIGGDELIAQQKKAEETQYNAGQFFRWLEGDLSAIEDASKKLAALGTKAEHQKQETLASEVTVNEVKSRQKSVNEEQKKFEVVLRQARNSKDKDAEKQANENLKKKKSELSAVKNQVSKAGIALNKIRAQMGSTLKEIERVKGQLKKSQDARDEHLRAGENVQGSSLRQQELIVTQIAEFFNNGGTP